MVLNIEKIDVTMSSFDDSKLTNQKFDKLWIKYCLRENIR